MNRTVSLVDLSEKALRAAGILYAGFPKIAEELQEMAADMLIAAAENGEMAVSELDGLREELNPAELELASEDASDDRIDLVRQSDRLSDVYGDLMDMQDSRLDAIRDEIIDVAADLLTAAIERGEAKEEDVMRDTFDAVDGDAEEESSGGRNAAAPSVPVTGTRPMHIHLPAVPDGVTGAPRAVADPGRVIAEATARHNLGTGVVS